MSWIHSSKKEEFFYHRWMRMILKWALFAKKPKSLSHFFIHVFGFLVLFFWSLGFFDGMDFSKNPQGPVQGLLGLVNLVFHEAGHMIFIFFGRFMHLLGGSLLQCLIPVIVMVQFLRQKDNLSAVFGFWWLGVNFIDVAPYIYDAWDRKLVLVGGGTGRDNPEGHDWYNLLQMMNSLDSYAEIANFTARLGQLILILSFLWGAILLYKQFLMLKSEILQKVGYKK